MLASMTGFGRAVCDAPAGRLIVEIQSVNRKYLEISVSLPREFSRFEPELRKLISNRIARGSLSVRVFLFPNIEAVSGLLPDVAMLKELKAGWQRIACAIGTDPEKVDLPFIMQYLPVQSKQEVASDGDFTALLRGVEEALESFCLMKVAEGEAIARDLSGRVEQLERMTDEIERASPDAVLKMRQKLFEKIEGLCKLGPEVEERLLREVALFSERIDISEELTRLRSHIAQFKLVLRGGVVGRKMDFLLQELGREVNTIGAKSVEAGISRVVIEMKGELEKIREQVQNIE